MSKLRGGFAVLIGVLILTAGCGRDAPGNSQPHPAVTPSKDPAFNGFDAGSRQLITTEAKWTTPKEMTVGNTERIGLSVGEGNKIKKALDTLVPGGMTTSAGQVQVGPTVRASLYASSEDADITPAEAVNASTGSDVQMLWTWLVHPKRPTDKLTLTAHLEVPLVGGHVSTTELTISLAIKRTFSYTMMEIATHWGTWSGIGASMAALWAIRRRRKNQTEVSA